MNLINIRKVQCGRVHGIWEKLVHNYERRLGSGEGRIFKIRLWVLYMEWPVLRSEVVKTGSHHTASSREAETQRVSSLGKD